MKNKKKLIITLVSILAVVLIGAITFIVLSKSASGTVNDLRIVDATTNNEINNKEVYLVQDDKNYFDVKIKAYSISVKNYIIYSSNPSVASVTRSGANYRVKFLKAGNATITATTADPSDIKDSFSLRINEYVPTGFKITDDNKLSETEVDMFADNKEYRFNFSAFQGTITENLNLSSLSVLDNYDKSVFDSVYIDSAKSQLVIKAKINEEPRKELITIVSKQADNEGNKKTVSSFSIRVNLKGYYISNIQLMLSTTPNFKSSKYIFGNGILNNGEVMVNSVSLTEEVNTIYAKVRIVYTNGYMADVTQNVVTSEISGRVLRQDKTDYCEISVKKDDGSFESARIGFSYVGYDNGAGGTGIELDFIYLQNGTQEYEKFVNEELYKKVDYNNDGWFNNIGRPAGYVSEQNQYKDYYEYIYWDTRFKRNDTIANLEGKIMDFVNTPPTCKETFNGVVGGGENSEE